MKLERSKNAKKNMIHGFVNKVLLLFFPFLVQTAIIRMLGMEYVGIKGLFSSILQVLNLTELGVGSAIVYSMYKPIAADDTDSICGLLNLYRKIYRYIGLCILTIGFIMMPFLPLLVKGVYPDGINLYIIFFLYLLDTVLSYWMFAYKVSLLNAFQRLDVINKIATLVRSIMCIVQILILISTHNYYLYVCVSLLFTVINNVLISYEVRSLFPEYKCRGKIPQALIEDIKEKVKGLLVYKICGSTRNAFDNIFISMFLGLTLAGIYNNYFYIFTTIAGFLSILTSSLAAGIGNSIASESVKKNHDDMIKIDFVYMMISGWSSICLLFLYQPFMKVWAGEKSLFSFDIVILIVIYFYIMRMGDVRALYSDSAGLWWENRYRTIAEAIANVIMNYVFIRIWGIKGIVLATILSLFFIGYLGSVVVIYKYYFKKGIQLFFARHAVYALVTIINASISYIVCRYFSDILRNSFLASVIVCFTIVPFIYFLLYRNTTIYKDSMCWLKKKLLEKRKEG